MAEVTKLEPNAISTHRQWEQDQRAEIANRVAKLQKDLLDLVPPKLDMWASSAGQRVLKELLGNGLSYCIIPHGQSPLRARGFERVEDIRKSFEELALAWAGQIKIDVVSYEAETYCYFTLPR